MVDIFGRASLDYFHDNYTEDIVTWTNITSEDVMRVPYLFRSYRKMPKVERKAMDMAEGRILDVGCCAGAHSVYLQKNGFEVTSIDISEGAIEVCKLRGLKDARNIDLLKLKSGKFDTILLLMNGTGIFRSLKEMPKYLLHLKTLLNPGGQILVDSTDLRYMYDDDDLIIRMGFPYYGEVEFGMRYKELESKPFVWLYLDENTFERYCNSAGLDFKLITRGNNHDYLARITLSE